MVSKTQLFLHQDNWNYNILFNLVKSNHYFHNVNQYFLRGLIQVNFWLKYAVVINFHSKFQLFVHRFMTQKIIFITSSIINLFDFNLLTFLNHN